MFNKIINPFLNLIDLKFLIRKTNTSIIYPLYHTVSDESLPHINNLYQYKSSTQFKKDLSFLTKNFKSCSIEKVAEYINNKMTASEPTFHLTFDDGLREVKEVIAPILLKKGVHATFFLNSSFIDNKALFYRFKASLIADVLKTQKFSKITDAVLESKLSGIKGKTTIEKVLNIKYFNQHILNDIAELVDVNFNEFLKKKPYLSSEDVRWLIDQGFSIGAHSVDHPKFQEITLYEQLQQTETSIEFIKDNFNTKLNLFAFPFCDTGVSHEFFESIYNKGNFVDLSFGTFGLRKDKFEKTLQRIAMEETDYSVEEIVKRNYLKLLILNLSNSSFIKR